MNNKLCPIDKPHSIIGMICYVPLKNFISLLKRYIMFSHKTAFRCWNGIYRMLPLHHSSHQTPSARLSAFPVSALAVFCR